jgi:hypothetical protein
MTVSEVVVAGCALAIVLLAVGMVGLARRFSRLSQQVARLQRVPEPAPVPAPDSAPPSSSLDAAPGRLREGDPYGEEVSVITHLDVDPGPAPTTARVASVTRGSPLIKVAAFTHGVRRALREEQRMRIAYAVRKELRQQRKTRRRRRGEQAPSQGWRP